MLTAWASMHGRRQSDRWLSNPLRTRRKLARGPLYSSTSTRRGSPIKMGSDSHGLRASVKLIMAACMMRLSCSPNWKKASEPNIIWALFDEQLRRVREVYALEKEANRRILVEFALMKDRLLQLEEWFGAGNGDAGQGAEAAGEATFSGPTLTEGTGKPSGVSGAATQHPSSPPSNVNVNLSADTKVRRTCNEDVLGNRQNVTIFAGEANMQSEPTVQGANKNYELARPADVDDSGIALAAQSSAKEVATEDAKFMPPTIDSVPVSDGDAGMGEEPPITGDGGYCVADMGMSTTTHAGGDQSCPRSSNIVSRMKKVPRLQKPSRVRGSPYTNPTRGMKGGRKGLKSTATGVKAYLTWTLSPAELDLLAAVRARCKDLKDDQYGCKNFDLPEASEKHVNAEFLKGLINVVLTRGVVDRPGRYCIGSFAVHQYCKLLDFRQCEHKRYYRMSIFLDRHDQKVAIGLALMKLAEFTDVLRWEMEHTDCPQKDNGHDCSVYMLMFMDLLSIRADGLYFGQPYVCRARQTTS
ncbi:LOW QUALITY PROTEIN: hypothetical protein Cgig2_009980 [Carnegiea gigantea]|uniref:Ubiquitin-like protease family profile domain-containing protein n=1 Tax=Carnegiea gigantea TaxID=171969 RepID=A0A9Q1JPU7_9CARY|nr:LOW QUALITY PROTEIN: hypothetical protein Cgig2_009980 [Carnegiea gigantea]